MLKNIIEIIGLDYLNVFENFCLGIEENKLISICGPNNCGKTTLLRILDRQIDINNTIVIDNMKIEDYKITELSSLIKTIIPKEIVFISNTVEEELNFYLEQSVLNKEEKAKLHKKIVKELKLTKILSKEIRYLDDNEIIKLQLATALLVNPKIILIDNIGINIEKKEMINILNFLKEYQQIKPTTIVLVTSCLEEALLTDYMYVISDSQIQIEGIPIEIIQKDNIMNKAGLNLPFMTDLSVKLRDYDLLKDIEQDKERMVELLWK